MINRVYARRRGDRGGKQALNDLLLDILRSIARPFEPFTPRWRILRLAHSVLPMSNLYPSKYQASNNGTSADDLSELREGSQGISVHLLVVLMKRCVFGAVYPDFSARESARASSLIEPSMSSA